MTLIFWPFFKPVTVAFAVFLLADVVGAGTITAFAGTFAAGTGVTLAGKATVPASGHVNLLVTRTGAATVTVTVL